MIRPFAIVLSFLGLFIKFGVADEDVSCTIGGATTTYNLKTGTVTTVDGDRDFLYYVGDGSIDTDRGVMMYLHGGAQDASSAAGGSTDCLWLKMSKRTSQLMVFPNGRLIDDSDPRKGRTWNTCLACNRTSPYVPSCSPGVPYDDVAYIRKIANWAKTTMKTDPTRVYVAGSSYGGLMVERLALELSDKISAAASLLTDLPVANDTANKGYTTTYTCDGYESPYPSTRMVPMFLFKGDADMRLPYGSDNPADFDEQTCQVAEFLIPGGNYQPPCQLGALYEFKRTLAFWQWKLRMTSSPENLQQPDSSFTFQDIVPSKIGNPPQCDHPETDNCDGSYMVRFNYGSPSPNYKLIWYRGVGAGHTFPGPNPPSAQVFANSGYKNRDPLVGTKYIVEDIATFFQHWTTTNV